MKAVRIPPNFRGPYCNFTTGLVPIQIYNQRRDVVQKNKEKQGFERMKKYKSFVFITIMSNSICAENISTGRLFWDTLILKCSVVYAKGYRRELNNEIPHYCGL